MNLRQIRDDLLRKIWVERPGDAPAYLFDDVATAVNQAAQVIWLAEELHFSRAEYRNAAFPAGMRKVTLGGDVQRVLGEVRKPGGFLRPVRSRGDIENYARRYLGQMEESTGSPAIYWVQSAKSSGSDMIETWLWVAPTPSVAIEISVQVELDAPRYSVAQLAAETAVSMPHQYVETLFLPLARFFVTRSHWFSNEEHRQALKDDAEAAMTRFGMAVPWRTEGKEAAA